MPDKSESPTITRRWRIEVGLAATAILFFVGAAWRGSSMVSDLRNDIRRVEDSFRSDFSHITESLREIKATLAKTSDGVTELYRQQGVVENRVTNLETHCHEFERRLTALEYEK